MRKIILTLIISISCISLIVAQSGFHLIKKTIVGGEGGWDYLNVDAANNRLYLSHSNQVEILNAKTHEKVGVIPVLMGVHGVIAIPKEGKGITTNGRSNSATIFDLKTLASIVELPTGKNPDALLYVEFSKRVFIFNHSDVTATSIDLKEGKVVGTIDVGGSALEAGASDGKGTIFVNLEDAAEIVSFDAKTLVVKNRWKLGTCEEPTGLAIDTKTNRLFSVCHSGVMMVVDASSGKIISELPIGKRVDGVVFDPTLKLAFTSNGDGTITIVKELSPNEFKVIETLKSEVGARTITLNSLTHHIYLTTAAYGETPAPTAETPNPRPKVVPGTFMVLEYGQD